MKAAELRIGNYVNISKKVNQMQLVNFVEIHYTENFENYEPIPLTEKWLLKLGFGDITNECATKAVNIKTFCKTFRVEGCNEQQTIFIELGSRGWTFKSIGYPLYNYVHQLQNLYFALTSQELKIAER